MRGSRRRLPRQLRAGLEPGERILAWGIGGDPGATDPGTESFVVVTSHRLLAPGTHEPVRWEHAVLASWDEPVLAITSQTGPATTMESIYVLAEPGAVPAHVRDRVESMILVQRRVKLGPGEGARLIARRRPGSGDVYWTVLFDHGLDPGDAQLRARADAALAELRAGIGV